MYDVNPDIYGEFLSLNVDADNSSIDFELAINAAPYYGIEKKTAREQVEKIKSIVRENWKKTANLYGISRAETERMEPAFYVCE